MASLLRRSSMVRPGVDRRSLFPIHPYDGLRRSAHAPSHERMSKRHKTDTRLPTRGTQPASEPALPNFSWCVCVWYEPRQMGRRVECATRRPAAVACSLLPYAAPVRKRVRGVPTPQPAKVKELANPTTATIRMYLLSSGRFLKRSPAHASAIGNKAMP